jgi:hypothetical protein
MHRLGARLVVPALVLVAVAGCGSDDSSSSAGSSAPSPSSASTPATANDQTQQWADHLCSAAATWKGQLSSATKSLADTANLSVNGVKSSLSTMASATADFADDLRGLGSPGTQAGDEAQQALTDLGDTLDAQRERMSTALAGVTTARQLVSAVPVLTMSLSAMGSAFTATAQQLATIDGADELRSAFSSSVDCSAVGLG